MMAVGHPDPSGEFPKEVTEMSEMMTTVRKWQDEYFTAIKRVEEPVVRFTGRMAESMVRYVPERPAFMVGMPTMAEMVDNQLKFRRRMVDEQAVFVRKMVKAMHPALAKFEAAPMPAPVTRPVGLKSPTATPAGRRTAKRAAPKRMVRKVA
jgi:hypothetical protein